MSDTPLTNPRSALFVDEKPLPDLPAVVHYAGAERFMRKALELQQQLGPVFDLTCDCEDGAPSGREAEHARMAAAIVMSDDNRFGRVGARIHDITHPHWQADVDILLEHAGSRLAFITLPKVRSVADARAQMDHVRASQQRLGITRQIPFHVLIETHGGVRDVHAIAALEGVEVLDFGLMDFVSAHQGAIPASAMKSPGQFTHPLVVRAKCEIAAAALANGVVPAHNVTTELDDPQLAGDNARRARDEFGFLRMWSIHPTQIEAILAALRPDASEVTLASDILLAAQDAAWGPIRHDGHLHDRASYRYYWSVLSRARVMGMTLTSRAKQRFFND